jgi:hypothetical protein
VQALRGMDALHRLLDRQPFPVVPDDLAPLGVDPGMFQCVEDQIERLIVAGMTRVRNGP